MLDLSVLTVHGFHTTHHINMLNITLYARIIQLFSHQTLGAKQLLVWIIRAESVQQSEQHFRASQQHIMMHLTLRNITPSYRFIVGKLLHIIFATNNKKLTIVLRMDPQFWLPVLIWQHMQVFCNLIQQVVRSDFNCEISLIYLSNFQQTVF